MVKKKKKTNVLARSSSANQHIGDQPYKTLPFRKQKVIFYFKFADFLMADSYSSS